MSKSKNRTRITLDILLYFLSFTMCSLLVFLAIYYYVLEVEKVAKETYQNIYTLNEQVISVKDLTDEQYYDISKWLIDKNNEEAIQNVIFRYQYRWPTLKKKLQYTLENQLQDSLTFAIYNIITNIDTLFEKQRKQLWEPEIINSYNIPNDSDNAGERSLKQIQNLLHFHEQSNRKVTQNLDILSADINNKSQIGIEYFYSTLTIQKTTIIAGIVVLIIIFIFFLNYYHKFIYRTLNMFFQLFFNLVEGRKISEHLTDLSSSGKSTSMGRIFNYIKILSLKLNTVENEILLLSDKNTKKPEQQLKDNDPLYKALTKLRTEIQMTSIAEAKQEWEKNKSKVFEDITKQENLTIDSISSILIKEICITLEGHTGNIFVFDDEGELPVMRLRASYAFDRLKKRDAVYYQNDGIIGQIWQDPEVYTITNLSEDYLDIRSSLGDAHPSNVIIIPIIGQNRVYSIVEIASVNKFDNHKVEFIKKMSFILGTTFSNLIFKEKYERLGRNHMVLLQNNRSSKEELASTLKKLESIKAENSILKLDRNTLIESINKVFIRVEYNDEGIVRTYNQLFLEVFGYKKSEMRGQHHASILTKEYRNSNEYLEFWDKIKKGNIITKEEILQTKDGEDFTSRVYYAPFLDSKDNFEGLILFLEHEKK